MTMRLSLVTILSCSALALAAPKAPRTLVVAAGDCGDGELVASTILFTDALRGALKAELLSGEAVLEQLRPRPALALEELQRQIEGAQTTFYAGQHEKALEAVQRTLVELMRVPPTAGPWAVTVQALVLQALALKALGRKAEMAESFRKVARVAPRFSLDADLYTPSTVAQFTQLRDEVASGRKVPLSVESVPPGAEVFLDGAPQGKTPLKLELPPATYRLVLAEGQAISFPRELKVARAQAVVVDLAFEGAVRPQPPLCVQGKAPDAALKLAARAQADQVVVLRYESRNQEPGWVSAQLFEVSRNARVREGGIRLPATGRGAALFELGRFVTTGQPGAQVVVGDVSALAAPAPPEAPRAAAPVVATASATPAPAAAPAQAQPEVSLTPAPAEAGQQLGARGVGPRVAGGVLLGAGVGAAVTGLVVYLAGGADRQTLSDNLINGALPPVGSPLYASTLEAAQRQKTTQPLAIGLLAGGGAVAVGGLLLLLLLPPREGAPAVALVPKPGGAELVLSGSL